MAMVMALGAAAAACSLRAARAEEDNRPPAGAAEATPRPTGIGDASGVPHRRPGRTVAATVPVPLALRPQAHPPPQLCMGGGSLTGAIVGPANVQAAWELRADTLVIAHGVAALDDRGWGLAVANLPDVLARARAVLNVSQGRTLGRRRIDILPRALLRTVRQTLRQRGVGVMDPCGLVDDALRAQQVDFMDLGPQLQHDFFRGEIAILAGFDDANALREACRQLTDCARRGAALIVLNPPAGFRLPGVSRAELPAGAPERRVRLDAELTRTLRPADFLPDAKTGLIDAGEAATVLAWLDRPARKPQDKPAAKSDAAEPTKPDAGRALVAAVPLGRGVVLAAALPELADCYQNPAGRCMLSEMILWTLKRPWRPKEHK